MKIIRILSFTIILILILLSFDFTTKIGAIQCNLVDLDMIQTCPDTIIAHFDKLYGTSLLDSNLNKSLTGTENFILLSSKKKFPQTLELNFELAKILYKLDLDSPLFVSESGHLYAEHSQEHKIPTVKMPELTNNFTAQVPQSIHDPISQVLLDLQSIDIEVTTINWKSDQEMEISSSLKEVIIVNPQKLKSLDTVIPRVLTHSKYKEEKESITEIDLRFSHLILR